MFELKVSANDEGRIQVAACGRISNDLRAKLPALVLKAVQHGDEPELKVLAFSYFMDMLVKGGLEDVFVLEFAPQGKEESN
jgi:hypothetical protein